jgi:hypothetical protein
MKETNQQLIDLLLSGENSRGKADALLLVLNRIKQCDGGDFQFYIDLLCKEIIASRL